MESRRIAILHHKNEESLDLERYLLPHMANYWREDGHAVIDLFGTRNFVPADILIVHVNLSVVPDPYLEFAHRYPVVINGAIKDIRKSAISTNLVELGDGYDGPVIVKADLNHAGYPEHILDRTWLEQRFKLARRVKRRLARVEGSMEFEFPVDYRVFDSINDVPDAYLRDKRLVVEKFLPDFREGLYWVENYQFLGDREMCERYAGKSPVVNSSTYVQSESVEPHPDIVVLRHQLGFDFGKFDYVVRDGKPILLDANKTTGASVRPIPRIEEGRRYRAEGLYSYFDS